MIVKWTLKYDYFSHSLFSFLRFKLEMFSITETHFKIRHSHKMSDLDWIRKMYRMFIELIKCL